MNFVTMDSMLVSSMLVGSISTCVMSATASANRASATAASSGTAMTTTGAAVACEGGCACGAIRYRVTGGPTALVLCHCRDCRIASGAPALAWAVFRTDDVAWLHGEPRQFVSSPGVSRGFCGRCGTTLSYRRDTRADCIDVTSATFDEPGRFAPLREIWTAQRLPWISANASLAQHPGSSKSG